MRNIYAQFKPFVKWVWHCSVNTRTLEGLIMEFNIEWTDFNSSSIQYGSSCLLLDKTDYFCCVHLWVKGSAGHQRIWGTWFQSHTVSLLHREESDTYSGEHTHHPHQPSPDREKNQPGFNVDKHFTRSTTFVQQCYNIKKSLI